MRLNYYKKHDHGIKHYALQTLETGQVHVSKGWLKGRTSVRQYESLCDSLFEAIAHVQAIAPGGEWHMLNPKTLREYSKSGSSALHEARKASFEGYSGVLLGDGSIRVWQKGRTLLLKKNKV